MARGGSNSNPGASKDKAAAQTHRAVPTPMQRCPPGPVASAAASASSGSAAAAAASSAGAGPTTLHLAQMWPTAAAASPRQQPQTPQTGRSSAGLRAEEPAVLASSDRDRGPEPWALQDPSAPAPVRTSSYREQLRARGQQAMQRSWEAAITARTQPPSPTLAQESTPTSMMYGYPGADDVSPSDVALWSMLSAWMEQQGPAPGEARYDAQAMDTSGHAGAWLDEPTAAALAWDAAAAQHMGMGMAVDAMAVESPGWSQEGLLAILMPGGPMLDKEHIAAELRAVAPCAYDD